MRDLIERFIIKNLVIIKWFKDNLGNNSITV